jgi:hypothetical protein
MWKPGGDFPPVGESLKMAEIAFVEFVEPIKLPCAISRGDGPWPSRPLPGDEDCGTPTGKGLALLEESGFWLLIPICPACAPRVQQGVRDLKKRREAAESQHARAATGDLVERVAARLCDRLLQPRQKVSVDDTLRAFLVLLAELSESNPAAYRERWGQFLKRAEELLLQQRQERSEEALRAFLQLLIFLADCSEEALKDYARMVWYFHLLTTATLLSRGGQDLVAIFEE